MAIAQNHIINIQPGVSAPLVIHCSQGDTGTQINLTVVNGDEEFDCSSYACSVHGTRSDRANWGPVTCNVSGSTVSFSLTSEMTAVAGSCLAEVSIGTVGTANFAFLVENATFEGGVTYSNDVSVYQSILAAVQTGISNETSERVAAVENEKNERIAAVNAEATARQAANNTLQGNINSETSARAAADAENSTNINIQAARIDNIISSQTPTDPDAELLDIRLGANSHTYTTAGTAVRSQISALKNEIAGFVSDDYCLDDILGSFTFAKGYWDDSGYHRGSTNTIAMSTIQTATHDMIVYTDNSSVYCFTVFIWSETGTTALANNWYDREWFPIHKGHRYTVQMRYADTRTINVDDAIKEHIHICNILGEGAVLRSGITRNDNYIYTSGGGNYGYINRLYAKEDRIIGLTDYSASNDRYGLAIWDNDTDYFPSNKASRCLTDTIIPKGKYYLMYKDATSLANLKDESVVEKTLRENLSTLVGLPLDVSLIRDRLIKLESSNELPSYYDTYLSNKCDTINGLKPTSGTQFAFLTDIHLNTYNSAKRGKAILHYIAQNTLVDTVVFGGDSINGNYDNPPSVAEYTRLQREAYDYVIPDDHCNVLFVTGNHDTGIEYNASSEASPRVIDDATLARNTRPIIKNLENLVFDANGPLNYLVDDPYNKIRYVTLTANLTGYGATTEHYGDQVRWLGYALTSCPSGYTIVVLNHVAVNHPDDTALEDFSLYLVTMCDEYNSRVSSSTPFGTNQNAVFDFSECTGTVACWVCGHTHIDLSFSSPNGIPVIVTTTDNAGGESSLSSITREIGTTSEQAIDVFTINTATRRINVTRVGGGVDREFSY